MLLMVFLKPYLFTDLIFSNNENPKPCSYDLDADSYVMHTLNSLESSKYVSSQAPSEYNTTTSYNNSCAAMEIFKFCENQQNSSEVNYETNYTNNPSENSMNLIPDLTLAQHSGLFLCRYMTIRPVYNNFNQFNKIPIAYTFLCIESDYSLIFSYITNKICGTILLRNKQTDIIKIHNAYEKYKSCLSKKYICQFLESNFIISDENNWKFLFYQYVDFKNWMNNTYKFKSIKSGSNYNQIFITYQTKIFEKYNDNLKDALDLLLEAFNSSNYNFLYKLIPIYNLIHKITMFRGNYSKSITIVLYLKLIISKIEIFRYDFFGEQNISETIEKLYENNMFNKLIAEIGMIFAEVINLCFTSKEILEVVEVLNFIYFIRAYYNDFYKCSEILRNVVDINSVDEVLRSTYDEQKNLIYISFAKTFKEQSFYKMLVKIIEEYNITQFSKHKNKSSSKNIKKKQQFIN